MIKLKPLFKLICCGIPFISFGQTTVSTNHTNNNGNGSIIFNVQNTNTFAITVTELQCHLGTTTSNNLELLYNTSPYNDTSAPWSFGTVGAGQNGWISAGTGTISSNTANGVVTALSNICITIPAGTTYQFGFSATTLQYMTLTAGNVNTFSAGGVNILTGDGMGWGGTVYPATPANYPRGFIGGITFVQTTPGVAPNVPGLSATNGTICSGNSSTLSVTSGSLNSAANWKWYSTSCGVGSVGTGTSIVVSPVSTTTYYVRGEGGCGYTPGSCATVSVEVNPTPTVAANSGTICAGQSFTLVPSGATSYSYSSGNAIVSPTVNTSYTITGTTNGCSSSTIASVDVNQLPMVTVNSGSVCEGTSFTMTPGGAITYTFNNGNAVVTPSTTSSYTVTGTDANGCDASAVSTVTVNAPSTLASSSHSLLCVGQSATLTASGAATYTWNTNQSTSSIVVNPTVTTSYTVTGEDANGCQKTATVTQNVSNCTGIGSASFSDSEILIFPNPATSKITIVNAPGQAVSIFNCLGACIYKGVVDSDKFEIDLRNVSAGVYFVKTNHATMKLIKE